MDDGIEGVCRWKRVEVASPVIDWKGLEDNLDVVDANTTPEKRIVAFKVKPYRPY